MEVEVNLERLSSPTQRGLATCMFVQARVGVEELLVRGIDFVGPYYGGLTCRCYPVFLMFVCRLFILRSGF